MSYIKQTKRKEKNDSKLTSQIAGMAGVHSLWVSNIRSKHIKLTPIIHTSSTFNTQPLNHPTIQPFKPLRHQTSPKLIKPASPPSFLLHHNSRRRRILLRKEGHQQRPRRTRRPRAEEAQTQHDARVRRKPGD